MFKFLNFSRVHGQICRVGKNGSTGKRAQAHFRLAISKIKNDEMKGGWNERMFKYSQLAKKECKRFLTKVFYKWCSTGFFTLKHHLLYNLVENLHEIKTLYVLNASLFEQYVVDNNQVYKQTSKKSDRFSNETRDGVTRQQMRLESAFRSHSSESEDKHNSNKKKRLLWDWSF